MSLASTREVLERKYTVPQAALILGVSKMTVYRLIHNNKLKSYRVSNRLVIPMSALRELIGNGLINAEKDTE